MKNVEKQLYDVKNTCKNLALRNDILEDKCNQLEQRLMSHYIEICGIKEEENEDIQKIVEDVGKIINRDAGDIIKAYWKKNKKQTKSKEAKPAIVVVSLREGCRDQWLEAGKNTPLIESVNEGEEVPKIYMREALTPFTSHLLWKAKTDLKTSGLFKYVWCKNGTVLAKKGEHANDKVYPIRTTTDVDKLRKEFAE